MSQDSAPSEPGNGGCVLSCCALTSCCREDDSAGVLAWLEEKIADVTMLPVELGEAFNVLR